MDSLSIDHFDNFTDSEIDEMMGRLGEVLTAYVQVKTNALLNGLHQRGSEAPDINFSSGLQMAVFQIIKTVSENFPTSPDAAVEFYNTLYQQLHTFSDQLSHNESEWDRRRGVQTEYASLLVDIEEVLEITK